MVDQVGNAILEFVIHAGETTQTELQEAREAAEYLADQLRAANDQINDLEAAVRCHQARADRAEEWLRQISSEIEHGSARRPSEIEHGSARRLGLAAIERLVGNHL
jgi:septal ring factor EnvC (AmiA/AmiB activator)